MEYNCSGQKLILTCVSVKFDLESYGGEGERKNMVAGRELEEDRKERER